MKEKSKFDPWTTRPITVMENVRSLRQSLLMSCFAVALLFLPVGFLAQENQVPSGMRYYPLAVGNTWQYSVLSEGKVSTASWKVVNKTSNAAGAVFGVWPFPAEADDEGMQLQVTPDGLLELSANFYLFQFPMRKGGSWKPKGHERQFSLLSEGDPCTVGKFTFQMCAVVQDDDKEANLRTVTTYAYDVGPVRYEYYKWVNESFEKEPTQTLKIVSYSLRSSRGHVAHPGATK